MYVTQFYGNTVSVISSSSNSIIGTVSVEKGPLGVAYDPANQHMYIADNSADVVSVLTG